MDRFDSFSLFFAASRQRVALIFIRRYAEFLSKAHYKIRAIGKAAFQAGVLDGLPRAKELFRFGKALCLYIVRRSGLEISLKTAAQSAFRYIKPLANVRYRAARLGIVERYILNDARKARRQALRLNIVAAL